MAKIAGLGHVVHGAVEGPVAIMGGLFGVLALMLGIICVLRAMVFYQRFRRDPNEYPIRRVLVLLLMGATLFGFLLIYRWTEGAMPWASFS